MRYVLALLFYLFFFIGFAQNSNHNPLEASKTTSKLAVGEKLKAKNFTFTFLKVIEDSRCPKNATCIWEGRVVFLIDVYKNEKFLEQKKITISPVHSVDDKIGNIFSAKELVVSAFQVTPYPIADIKINPEDYCLQVEVINLR